MTVCSARRDLVPRIVASHLLAALLLATPAHAAAPAARHVSSWPSLSPEVWQEPARPDSGGRDALILSERGDLVDGNDSFRFTLFRRIRVFTAEGRAAGAVALDFSRATQRIESVRARVIRSYGAVAELSADQIVTSTVWKSRDGERSRLSFVAPGIEPGCVVEYECVLAGHYPAGRFWPWYFQHEIYTRESTFHWVPWERATDATTRCRWDVRRLAPARVEQMCRPSPEAPKEVTLRALCLPGTGDEAWAPPGVEIHAYAVVYYGTRNTVPEDYWMLWKRGLNAIGDQFGEDLGSLGGVVAACQRGGSAPEEALACLHTWLRTHVRSIAEKSWKEQQGDPDDIPWMRLEARIPDPSAPDLLQWVISQRVLRALVKGSPTEALLARGWGTDYEINAAFAAGARRLGFNACVGFVGDRRVVPFDSRRFGAPPSETITAVDLGGGRWRFYQPSSRFSPTGSPAWYLRGGQVLTTGARGGALVVRVGPDQGAAGAAAWALDLTLDPAGGVRGRVVGWLSGELARDTKAWLWEQDPDTWGEQLQDSLAKDRIPALTFQPPDLDTHPDSLFALVAMASYDAIGSSVGRLMTVPLGRLAPWRLHHEFWGETRTQPVFLRYPRRDVVALDLHLPAGAELAEQPQPRRFESEVGRWETSWTPLADGIRLTRVAETWSAQFPPVLYPQVRRFFTSLEEADSELLLIRLPR